MMKRDILSFWLKSKNRWRPARWYLGKMLSSCHYLSEAIKNVIGKKWLLFPCLTFFLVLVSVDQTDAQMLIRESISSAGSRTVPSYGITILQSVGQPYNTVTTVSDKLVFSPGFQKPLKYEVVQTISTFRFDFAVYPNPVAKKLTIKSGEVIANALVQIKNITGDTVYAGELENTGSQSINCEEWKEGIYLISIKDRNSASQFSSKLIVTK